MEAEDLEALHLICFEIIGYVGAAKSSYVSSIAKAKEGDFEGAESLIREGDSNYNKGHTVHMKLLQADAAGERNPVAPLILLHAEDQMASAETVKLLATNLISVYQELQKCTLQNTTAPTSE